MEDLTTKPNKARILAAINKLYFEGFSLYSNNRTMVEPMIEKSKFKNHAATMINKTLTTVCFPFTVKSSLRKSQINVILRTLKHANPISKLFSKAVTYFKKPRGPIG